MKKSILLLFVSCVFQNLVAPYVGIGTSDPKALLHVADSSVVFSTSGGNIANSTTPVVGAGGRMMWYAPKNAFRVGRVVNSGLFGDGSAYWNNANIGNYSFASGLNTQATAESSTAMGSRTTATGTYSVAMGEVTVASGESSTALGTATRATNQYSTSLNYGTTADGIASTAMGYRSKSRAYASVSIGSFNDTIASSNKNSWIATDPLVYIGNGSDNSHLSNAMVVYKNGNTDINGFTSLGNSSEAAPAIKMKKLTGVSAGAQNTWVNIAHGLTLSKIISVNVILAVPGFVNVPPAYTYNAGYEYQYQVAASNIVVINTNGNSANILNKNFTVLITYEE